MPQVFAGRTVIALERSAMTSRVVPRETTFSSLGDEAFFYYREDIMDYGKTLHLPQTEFPMRGNLPKREPQWLDFWQEHDIYKKRLAQREGAESFVLHDGPPYANGYLHIGHAMNKTLKDIIMKYKTMRGYYTPYRPGWDTHGLPIEHAVIKNTGLNRAEMSPLELRAKCLAYAKEFIEIQKKDFIRFGVMGDWDRPYLTFDPKLEDRELAVFGEMAKKGYIYKGRKTVYWCPVCETALAEAEIEYADKKSFSIFVKFPLIDARGFLPEGANKDDAVDLAGQHGDRHASGNRLRLGQSGRRVLPDGAGSGGIRAGGVQNRRLRSGQRTEEGTGTGRHGLPSSVPRTHVVRDLW